MERVLSNSFGFGGQNVCLVLGAAPKADAAMRALRLFGDRDPRLEEIEPPPPPGPGEVQLRMRAVALNHIDVWGWRGMAFAKRSLPLTVGAEAVGEVVALGEGVDGLARRRARRALWRAHLRHCRACREGRDNLCENVAGVPASTSTASRRSSGTCRRGCW